MQRAIVLGRAISTTKHPTMEGCRLLLMQPLDAAWQADGDPLVVVDTHGAAIGSVAVISSDGRFARQLLGSDATPVRYATIGLEDDDRRIAALRRRPFIRHTLGAEAS